MLFKYSKEKRTRPVNIILQISYRAELKAGYANSCSLMSHIRFGANNAS